MSERAIDCTIRCARRSCFDRLENDLKSMLGDGVALALGSSFLGMSAHCGFLAELEKAGVQPDRVAGASSGAYAGLLYAQGLRGEAGVDFIRQRGLTRSFLDHAIWWRLPGIITWTFGTGLFSGNRAVRFLKKRLGEPQLESFRKPRLEIAVTDLNSGQSLIVDQGDAVEHVIASCSVPGLLNARRLGDRILWDGGLANDVPFHHWVEDPDIHTIVIHSITHEQDSVPVPRWPNMAHGVAVGHQLVSQLLNGYRKELAELRGKRLIHLETKAPHPGWFNQRREPLIEVGRQSGRRAVDALREALGTVSAVIPA